MKLKYIKAGPEDIPEIISIGKKIWLPSFARYFRDEELYNLFTGMYNSDKLLETLNSPYYEFYFVRDENFNDVGYFAIEIKTPVLKIDKIYVDPALQRQGLGKKVIDHIYLIATENNIQTITLNVNRRNSSAISFYSKLGFKIIRSEDIPGPNGFIYDDYVMVAEL